MGQITVPGREKHLIWVNDGKQHLRPYLVILAAGNRCCGSIAAFSEYSIFVLLLGMLAHFWRKYAIDH
jgi:hypothetical protein